MSRALYNLPPAGVNLPARYKKTINSRRLFIDGAEAGLDGRPIDAEFLENLLAKQGKTAAYACARLRRDPAQRVDAARLCHRTGRRHEGTHSISRVRSYQHAD